MNAKKRKEDMIDVLVIRVSLYLYPTDVLRDVS